MDEKLQYELLSDVHETLVPIQGANKCCTVKRSYKYYHYKCDGFNDVGWGCGYRTLQTICSWIINAKQLKCTPPDIRMIQKILVDIGDKPINFYGSQDWIGSIEVSMVVKTLYGVDSKILHIPQGKVFPNYTAKLYDHFQNFGSPVMMGGEQDNSSKGIMGIACCDNKEYLLVVDPHFVGKISSTSSLASSRWVRWLPVSNFYAGFYNLALPMCDILENDTPI